MIIINKEFIKAFFVNVVTTFNKAMAEADPQWSKVATEVKSTGSENDYGWIKDGWPSLRKWIGDKVVKGLEAARYVIVNEPYEATIAVKRDDLEDEKSGQYAAIVRGHGDAAAAWPDELVFGALNLAFTKECFDGQYFVDTDHPVGEGVYSNKGTKKLDCTTLAKAMASYGAARKQMQSVKNDAGRKLKVKPNLLVVPPALEDVGKMLLTADKLPDGAVNIYKGTAELMVCGDIDSDTEWFLMDTTKPLKPLIYQNRKTPVPVSQTNPDSDEVFKKGVYLFSVEARGNAGFSFWQLIYGSTGADA